MNKKLFKLNSKDEVTGIYLIKYIALMSSKDAKHYLNIVLSDSSGDIESRYWNATYDMLESFSKGSFVKINGKVNYFQGKNQLILKSITLANKDEYNEDDYLMKTNLDVNQMYNELISETKKITNIYLRELTLNILLDNDISSKLKTIPAGKQIHHATSGGLLEHTLTSCKLAKIIAPFYNVNSDYVISGTILHDIGKVYELTSGPLHEYSDEGKLLGHIITSNDLIENFSKKINNFPHDVKIHLKHIVISHHGETSYGSPKRPITKEAMLVHYIDLIDSQINSFETAINTDKNQGDWTSIIKHLDRSIFKGKLPHYDEKIGNHKDEIKNSLGDKLKDIQLKK